MRERLHNALKNNSDYSTIRKSIDELVRLQTHLIANRPLVVFEFKIVTEEFFEYNNILNVANL